MISKNTEIKLQIRVIAEWKPRIGAMKSLSRREKETHPKSGGRQETYASMNDSRHASTVLM